MPVKADYINELESRHGSSPEIDELRRRYSPEASVGVLDKIDPEVAAKKATANIFSSELGLDDNTVNATYSNIVKNVYGEELKPSAVQKRMQEDGFLANPQADHDDMTVLAGSVVNNADPPQDLVDRRKRRRVIQQTSNVFHQLRKVDEDLFAAPTEFAAKILQKPDDDSIASLPPYTEEDLLDEGFYMTLLEQAGSQQQVQELRQERQGVINDLFNKSVQSQQDYIVSKGLGEFTTGSKKGDVVMEGAKGLYSAVLIISRGAWATSIAMGMEWNQPNVDEIDRALESAGMSRIEAAGKMGFVARAVSEAIPSFVYNMTVGKYGIFVTEYGNAYQDVKNNGGSELQANAVAMPVAILNTMIESLQIDQIFTLAGKGVGAKQAVKKMTKDKTYKAFLKNGAKFTGQAIKTALNEGIEGALQEGVSIAIPAFITDIYPKNEDGTIDWTQVGSQMGQAFVGEGLGGLALGLGGGVHNARTKRNYKRAVAGQLMVHEGMGESESLSVATKIMDRIIEQDGTPKEIYRQELGKIKPADNRHKAAAHIIKKAKSIPDEQYRQIAEDITGKTSMVDMNYDEAERFIDELRVTEAVKPEPVKTEDGAEKVEQAPDLTHDEILKEVQAIRDEEPTVAPAPVEAVTGEVEFNKGETQESQQSRRADMNVGDDVIITDSTGESRKNATVKNTSPAGAKSGQVSVHVEGTPETNTITVNGVDTQEPNLLTLPIWAVQQPQPPQGKAPAPVEAVTGEVEGKKAFQISREAKERGELTLGKLGDEVMEFKGKGGISSEISEEGFMASFRHKKTGEIFESKDETGRVLSIHLLDGIPDKYVTETDPRDGVTLAVSPDIEAGFTKGGKFFTRQEASDISQPPQGKAPTRKAFLDNTPFGNDKLLEKSVDEILEIAEPKVKKKKAKNLKAKNLKELEGTSLKESVKKMGEGTVLGIDKAFGIMSTRVKNISNVLFQDIRNKVINPSLLLTEQRTKRAHPFVDGIMALPNDDLYDFKVAQWQGNEDDVLRIIRDNGLQAEYDQYRELLEELYYEGNAVGMNIDYRTAYFPSAVKDFKGLMKHINQLEEYAPIIEAMKAAEERKGRPLSQDEKLRLVDTLLRGFRISGLTLSKPGFAKERTMVRDDIELVKYYHGFEESTSRYIESMTENIQERKFFGKTTKELVDLRANISRTMTSIAKIENGQSKAKNPAAVLAKAKLRLAKLEAELSIKDDKLLENSVANHILGLVEQGLLDYDQQAELQGLLEGLFKTTPSYKWVHTLRSLEYAGSLAQLPAVVTQYSEVVLAILKSPGTTLPAFIRANLQKSDITLKDIGVAHIGQEWVDADLDKTVTALLKPFEMADKVGKETFVNSVVKKYRKMATANPDKARQEIAKYYPEEGIDSVLESLKSGKIDDNVKGFALNELADVQPISKFEVPELYAKAGNLRVFYMYKTFVLKRLDILRSQGYNEIKAGIQSGNKRQAAKGLAKLVWMALMFSLADASADVVKDLIRGKPLESFDNYIADNLLQMIMLSKYSINKSKREGPGAFFKDNITLPISNINAAARDLATLFDEDSEKGSELVRRMPWIGELYYWYIGEGARKIDEGVYDD